MNSRFAKALGIVALFNGLLFLSTTPEALAGNEEDAKKWAMDLKSKDTKARVVALQGLGRLAAIMKSYVTGALPDIYKALGDKDASIRAAAAQCIGACDEPPEKVVPELVKLLKDDKDEGVKLGAVKGLASMGSGAKTAVPTLRTLSGDKTSKVGKAAKAALKVIVIKN